MTCHNYIYCYYKVYRQIVLHNSKFEANFFAVTVKFTITTFDWIVLYAG